MFTKLPPRDTWIGPLGEWELIRLARRGQTTRSRLMVLYLMLLGFILLVIIWFPHIGYFQLFTQSVGLIPIKDAASFSEYFTLLMLQAMLLAVAAMAPAYAAASISDEKDAQTLQLLLTTQLTDREIVVGKFFGRFVFVMAAAMAGLPVLALAMMYGGESLWFVLSGCMLITSTGLLATAIGFNAASSTPGLRPALIRAYGITAFAVFGFPPLVLSPFFVLGYLKRMQPETDIPTYLLLASSYPVFQSLIAIALVSKAIQWLRHGEHAEKPKPPALTIGARNQIVAKPLEPKPNPLPPIGEHEPLLWKERHVGRTAKRSDLHWLGMLVFGGLASVWMFLGWVVVVCRIPMVEGLFQPPWVDPAYNMRAASDGGGRSLMTGATFALGLYLIPVAINLAPAIVRERQKQTLDALLSIPEDRIALLKTKVRAAIERDWGWGAAGWLSASVAFGADGGWWLGITISAALLAGIAMVIALGTFLTVHCSTEVQSIRFLVPAVVAVVGMPSGLWNWMDWRYPTWTANLLAPGALVLLIAAIQLWRRGRNELEHIG